MPRDEAKPHYVAMIEKFGRSRVLWGEGGIWGSPSPCGLDAAGALGSAGNDGATAAMLKAERKGKFTVPTMLLLVLNGLFAAANAFSGTFVGVYLWKAKSDFAMIGFFSLCIHVAMALTFWLAGKWVKEYNKMNALRLGVAVSAAFYMLVLLFGTSAVSYIWLLGAVQGVAAGFFWLAFNVVYFEVTGPKTRDRFNGWAGLLGSSAGMAAPWISGLVIVHMPGMTGYRTIFSVSLGIFLVGVIVSFFMRNRKVTDDYAWGFMVSCLRQKRTPWRRVAAALVAQGFREGVFGFVIGLLVYISTADESKLGSFALITSAVAFASYWLAGKLLKPRLRKWGMLVGVTAMTLVIVPLFWQMSYLTLLVFGIGTALFFPLFSIPMTSSVFDLIGQSAESARRRVELIVMRELALNAGRILGTSLFVAVTFWSKSPPVFTTLLLVIGAAPLLSWWFMRGQFAAESRSESRSA